MAAGSESDQFTSVTPVFLSPSTVDQYQVLVSKVVVQCSTSSGLDIGANTVSYMYGANDTSGLPTVYASNRTALLNDGSARYSLPFIGASAWSLIALAVGAGTAFTF